MGKNLKSILCFISQLTSTSCRKINKTSYDIRGIEIIKY
jgi:hypothetical protein